MAVKFQVHQVIEITMGPEFFLQNLFNYPKHEMIFGQHLTKTLKTHEPPDLKLSYF